MKSTRVCPYCEGLTSQDLIFKEEAYKVRGETFEVSHSFYVCSTCTTLKLWQRLVSDVAHTCTSVKPRRAHTT